MNGQKLINIMYDVDVEVRRAMTIHTAFNSNHEGYAALLEEVDELWDEIKRHKNPKSATDKMKLEAVQIAAMAVRFIHDLYK